MCRAAVLLLGLEAGSSRASRSFLKGLGRTCEELEASLGSTELCEGCRASGWSWRPSMLGSFPPRSAA